MAKSPSQKIKSVATTEDEKPAAKAAAKETVSVDDTKKTEQQFYQKWWFWLIICVAVLAVVGAILMTGKKDGGSNKPSDTTIEENVDVEEGGGASQNNNQDSGSNSGEYALGKTFKFDGLELTLGSNLSTTVIDNEFSDYDGDTVIRMPIKVKNVSGENHSLNMFYFQVFGSKGTELDDVGAYFSDEDSVDYAGDLRNGAEYDKYIYFLYDGNGTYAIEFDDWEEEIVIEFNVNL